MPLPTHADVAAPFARTVLANLRRPYPYLAQHLQRDDDDVATPRELHPAFGTSYDWHSCVHMAWLATQVLDRDLPTALASSLEATLVSMLADDHLRVETEYLVAHPLFERPYGWAWAATLATGLAASDRPALAERAPAMRRLADAVLDLTGAWLDRATEPVRHGVHANSAFALRRLLLAARALDRDDTAEAIADTTRKRFGGDADWPFRFERSGHDFLSPGLAELDLMLVVLDDDAAFTTWADAFLQELSADADAAVLRPAAVLDPADAQQSHLYGLGLSSAATLGRFVRRVRAMPSTERAEARALDVLADRAAAAIPALVGPGLAAAVSDEYVSSHWLATFAWDAIAVLPTRDDA